MKAKLSSPERDKSWKLHICDVSESTANRNRVVNECLQTGKKYNTNPFKQGDFEDWIMIEYWTDNVDNVLYCAMETCDILKIELEL